MVYVLMEATFIYRIVVVDTKIIILLQTLLLCKFYYWSKLFTLLMILINVSNENGDIMIFPHSCYLFKSIYFV